jgi:GntR family transcriptional regulator
MGTSLVITVDPKADRPPSEQIASAVRFAIASGALTVGERLPSVRQLAVDALVNPNTVGKVWRDLERDGVLESRPGDGVFVARGAPTICRVARDRELNARLEQWVSDARRAGLTREQIEEHFERAVAPKTALRRVGGPR